MKNAPSFLANITDQREFDEDKLTVLRQRVVEAKELDLQIAEIEATLSEKKAALNSLLHKDLPELFFEVGIDEIAVPASGNFPSFRATCAPYYAASIPVKWDPAKRAAAFRYLEDAGAGDLIKTELNVKFQRTEHDVALRTAAKLQGEGLEPEVKEAVHQSTLTAWLREQCEHNNFMPDLDKIGGTVGRIVRIKDKK
jgi:hypothetical protein